VYDGDFVTVTEGVTHVAEGHELVRRFPHRFGRESTQARSRPRAIRGAPACGPRTVEFTERAMESLLWEIRESLDGSEAGGALFGYRRGDVIVIEAVGPPAMDAERSPTSTEVLPEHSIALERLYINRGSPCRLKTYARAVLERTEIDYEEVLE